MATHRPIDVLDDREADTSAAWLSAHPGIEIITRDRAGAYAEGARRGAPQAIQCANRWHIWQNLGQAVEKTVIAHRDCVRESFTAATSSRRQPARSDNADAADSMAKVDVPEVRDRFVQLRARTIERYDAVQRLRGQGMGLRTIAKELGIDRKTARRFAAASDPEDVIAAATSRAALRTCSRAGTRDAPMSRSSPRNFASSVTGAASGRSTATCSPTALAGRRPG